MATKAQLANARRTGKANAEAISVGAVLGAGTAPVLARAAMDAAPTLVSPTWDRAIAGAVSVGVGLAIPNKHKAAKYGAYATGAVMLGTALADWFFGPEDE